MAFLAKSKDEIIRKALKNLSDTTPVTANSPGSIARAITESITQEIADFYSILDFNLSLNVISTAKGRSLDLMGSLYNVKRKSLSEVATLNKGLGVFYFYLDSPNPSLFTIPAGTKVSTGTNDYVGRTIYYIVTEDVVFPIGRTRTFASIRPSNADSIFSVGAGSLVVHDFQDAPVGLTVKCTNIKPISAQLAWEDDDSYRNRIIASVRTNAGGTADAIRMAALGVTGVRDCVIRDVPYGLGSFEAIVIYDSATNNTGTFTLTQEAVSKVRPVGVRVFVREPDRVPLDITASLVVRKLVGTNLTAVANRAEIAAIRYINTLSISDTLIYNQLIQAIMDSSPETILDVSISRYAAKGEEIIRKNYTPISTEHIVPGIISMNIAS